MTLFYLGPSGSGQINNRQQNLLSDLLSEEREMLDMENEEVVTPQRTEDLRSEELVEENPELVETTSRRQRTRRTVNRCKLSNRQLKRRILMNTLLESELAIKVRRKQLQCINLKIRNNNNIVE